MRHVSTNLTRARPRAAPSFFKGGIAIEEHVYVYYSTQRPIDIGTTPRPPDAFINFDVRKPVEGGAFWAWGMLFYTKPLTAKEMSDYELRPLRENPDIWPTMRRQTDFVGEWEKRNNIPKAKRLTYWEECIRCFLPKQDVTPERMEAQYRLAREYPNGPLRYRRKKPSPQPGER